MSYFRRRALSGVSTTFPVHWRPRVAFGLGSLGDTTPPAQISTPTTPVVVGTLSQPTIPDPATAQWQANVLNQLQSGVAEMRRGDTLKLLQILATLSIPLASVVWKMIFKKGAASIGTGL